MDEIGEHAAEIVGVAALAARAAEQGILAAIDLERALLTLTNEECTLIDAGSGDRPTNSETGKQDRFSAANRRAALLRVRRKLISRTEGRHE